MKPRKFKGGQVKYRYSSRKQKSMALLSTPPKKRSRPKQRYPNSSSSSSILTSLEPSSNLFPSQKSEFIKLLAVVTIASFVAFSSNFVINLFNRFPIPFCDDTHHHLDDLSLSGTKFILLSTLPLFILHFYFLCSLSILYFLLN